MHKIFEAKLDYCHGVIAYCEGQEIPLGMSLDTSLQWHKGWYDTAVKVRAALVAENEQLRYMLDQIANHPNTPELIKQYAQGRLHSPNPLECKLDIGDVPI